MSRPLLVKDPLWFDSCKQPSPQFSNYQVFEFWVSLMGGSTYCYNDSLSFIMYKSNQGVINGMQMKVFESDFQRTKSLL